MKKWIIYCLAFTLSTSSLYKLEAAEYVTDTGGCGYRDCCRAICIVPAIGLAAALLAAMIAVGVHNRSSGGHTHGSDD